MDSGGGAGWVESVGLDVGSAAVCHSAVVGLPSSGGVHKSREIGDPNPWIGIALPVVERSLQQDQSGEWPSLLVVLVDASLDRR